MAQRASLHSVAKPEAEAEHSVPKDTEVSGRAPAGKSTEVSRAAGAARAVGVKGGRRRIAVATSWFLRILAVGVAVDFLTRFFAFFSASFSACYFAFSLSFFFFFLPFPFGSLP